MGWHNRTVALSVGLALCGLLVAEACAEPPQEWGTIKGRVEFDGDKEPLQTPPRALANSFDRQECEKAAKAAGKEILTENWVVNPKNKGVRWVIVWLVDANDVNAKLPIHPDLEKPKQQKVMIESSCCVFEPHIVCLREGQILVHKNTGQLTHNLKLDGPRESPTVSSLVPAGKTMEIGPWTAHPIPSMVSCTIHAWMRAYVRAFDHPYFAVTDADGNFEIRNAPAGNYRLVMWHEETGYFLGDRDKKGVPVTIKAKAETDLGKFKLTPDR